MQCMHTHEHEHEHECSYLAIMPMNAYRFYRVAYRFAYRFFVEQVHVHVCARMYVRIKIVTRRRTIH